MEDGRGILSVQDFLKMVSIMYGPDFSGETFRVLKEKVIRQFGENRTSRLVLEGLDRLAGQK